MVGYDDPLPLTLTLTLTTWREEVQAEERERRRVADDDAVERRPGVQVPHAQLPVDRAGDSDAHL